MIKKNGLWIGLTILFLCMIVLFIQSQSININQYHAVNIHLRQLKELNNELRRDILLLRTGLDRNYDIVQDKIRKIDELNNNLFEGEKQIYKKVSPGIDQRLNLIQSALKEQTTIAEEIISSNASLKNSLTYLPKVSHDILSDLSKSNNGSALSSEITNLYRDILTYNITLDPLLEGKIKETLLKHENGVTLNDSDSHDLFIDFLKHNNVILDTRQRVDQGLIQIMGLSVLDLYEDLFSVYNQELTHDIKVAETFQHILVTLCIGLFIFSIYSFLRVRQSAVALEEANQHLESRVKERTKELELARDQALSATKTKSALLANMSHELRTPLNAILGYSEYLQEVAEEKGQKDDLEDLKKIFFAGKHLLGLIDNILDLSKIDAGKMKLILEPVNIKETINELADIAKPLMMKNENTFKVSLPSPLDWIKLDLPKTRQCLFHLLSNAAKFTKKGNVNLDVVIVKNKNKDFIELRVKDTGIGIKPEIKEKIFEDFVQADSSYTRNFGGTGLGLTVSRRMARMMGGDITVTSEIDKGSTFILSLPYTPTTPNQAHPTPLRRSA